MKKLVSKSVSIRQLACKNERFSVIPVIDNLFEVIRMTINHSPAITIYSNLFKSSIWAILV